MAYIAQYRVMLIIMFIATIIKLVGLTNIIESFNGVTLVLGACVPMAVCIHNYVIKPWLH